MKTMDNSTKKGSRGGKREGAGRPSTDSKLYTFRAPKGMAEYIDAQDNKTDFIKNCIAKSIVDERTTAVASKFRHTVASEYGIVALFLDIDNVWQPTIRSVWQSFERIDILCR
ncbi:MAG: hypothetical protein E7082_07685 [Bacteroidales bacterium]|nr:hypothetical protein [Bacteroidales bacterium]